MRPAFHQTHLYRFVQMEVTPRFELGNEGFADPCLTTWLCHRIRENGEVRRFLCFWSGRRGSNSLPRPWQGRALPDELRPQMTPIFQRHGASGRSRTNDTRIFSPLLYQLSYLGKSFPRRTAREGNCNPKGTHEMELHLVGDGDPERARTVDL